MWLVRWGGWGGDDQRAGDEWDIGVECGAARVVIDSNLMVE